MSIKIDSLPPTKGLTLRATAFIPLPTFSQVMTAVFPGTGSLSFPLTEIWVVGSCGSATWQQSAFLPSGVFSLSSHRRRAELSTVGCLPTAVRRQGTLSDWVAVIPGPSASLAFWKVTKALGSVFPSSCCVALEQQDLSGGTRKVGCGYGNCQIGNASEYRICFTERRGGPRQSPQPR